jgi:hypothetical protein
MMRGVSSEALVLVLILVFCIVGHADETLSIHRSLMSGNVGRITKAELQGLPEMDDIDSIELYHLRSFRQQLVKSNAGSFSLQTSGLAFRSTTTNMVVVLEYRPFSYEASFLPQLRDTSTTSNTETPEQKRQAFHNITGNIFWETRAVIEYSTNLDIDYWQHSTYLGMINGIVYSNYASWVTEYMTSAKGRHFVPQAICSSPSSGNYLDEGSCFRSSQTWETFVSDSLTEFASMAAVMHAMLPPRGAEMQILSNFEPLLTKADPASTQHGHIGRHRNLQLTEEENEASKDTAAFAQAQHIAESDVHFYWQQLEACMRGYANEDYTSALTSCMPADIAYIHAGGEFYYMIEPRHPFVVNSEYLQVIPAAKYPPSRGILTSDWVIGSLLLLLVSAGLVLGLRNLKVYEAFCDSGSRRGRVGSSALQRYSGGIMEGISMSINSTTSRSWDRHRKHYSKAADDDDDGDLEMNQTSSHNPGLGRSDSNADSTGEECRHHNQHSQHGLHCRVTRDTPTVLNVPHTIFANYAQHEGETGTGDLHQHIVGGNPGTNSKDKETRSRSAM